MRDLLLPACAALALTACSGPPERRDPPPPRVEPAPVGSAAPVEVIRPGSRAAFLYVWREQLPTELPSDVAATPWKLEGADLLKTASGDTAWSLSYFLRPGDPARLAVAIVELPSEAAAVARLDDHRQRLVGGVDRGLALPRSFGRVVEASVQDGTPRKVSVVAGIAVERWVFIFGRALEGPAAPATLDQAPAIGAPTVRAAVDAVLPGKLPPG